MSAILSADDLNDFISPGVACIKPIETLPKQEESSNPYEVTTEDKVAATNAPPAQISLTDCLACSGCVTSAEAVLVSLQSHTEVLNTLDSYPSLPPHLFADHGKHTLTNWYTNRYTNGINGRTNSLNINLHNGKLFVASVSPQVYASIAATFSLSLHAATNMIHHLLAGPQGLASGGPHGSSFTWILDTNTVREIALVGAADEVYSSLNSPKDAVAGQEGALETTPKKPILTSACPGWICYAEKTHPHVLPHLSRLKSPQALAGTLLKSVLARKCGIRPDQIWHLALMPCFDKKLEASREELTSIVWKGGDEKIRDVDCVITARELLMLAQSRAINFLDLSRTPVDQPQFPDLVVDSFLFRNKVSSKMMHNGNRVVRRGVGNGPVEAGPSGGYLHHILSTYQAAHPGSQIVTERGRNADVVEYRVIKDNETLIRMARYYGFRNIQNLVRRLRPAKVSRLAAAGRGTAKAVGRRAGPIKANGVNGTNGMMGNGNGAVARGPAGGKEEDYAYVEVMACPGGCTNGGGQIRVQELQDIQGAETVGGAGPPQQREWLGRVEGKYFQDSGYEGTSSDEDLSVKKILNGTNGHASGNGYTNGDAMDLDAPHATELTTTNWTNQPDVINGIYVPRVRQLVAHWSAITGVDPQSLVGTSFRKVESNVGKKVSDTERVAGLAVAVGGGW